MRYGVCDEYRETCGSWGRRMHVSCYIMHVCCCIRGCRWKLLLRSAAIASPSGSWVRAPHASQPICQLPVYIYRRTDGIPINCATIVQLCSIVAQLHNC